MKKMAIFFLTLVMLLTLCACENQDTTKQSASSTTTYQSTKKTLTDDDIKSMVVDKLYNTIDREYVTADPGSCRYSINTTEKEGNYIYVYGSVTLYDKYGELTGGYSDGSGTPFRRFTVKISAGPGSALSCDID